MPKKDGSRGSLTVREAGDLGGQARKAKLGTEGYVELGRKGGLKVALERGSKYFSEIGQKGGASRKAKLGTEGYSALGRKGALARSANHNGPAVEKAEEPPVD